MLYKLVDKQFLIGPTLKCDAENVNIILEMGSFIGEIMESWNFILATWVDKGKLENILNCMDVDRETELEIQFKVIKSLVNKFAVALIT